MARCWWTACLRNEIRYQIFFAQTLDIGIDEIHFCFTTLAVGLTQAVGVIRKPLPIDCVFPLARVPMFLYNMRGMVVRPLGRIIPGVSAAIRAPILFVLVHKTKPGAGDNEEDAEAWLPRSENCDCLCLYGRFGHPSLPARAASGKKAFGRIIQR